MYPGSLQSTSATGWLSYTPRPQSRLWEAIKSGEHDRIDFTIVPDGGKKITVPVDLDVGSKQSDKKRKRNAAAASQFRKRKKKKEEDNRTLLELTQQQLVHITAERDFYKGEVHRYRELVLDTPAIRHHAENAPPSPVITDNLETQISATTECAAHAPPHPTTTDILVVTPAIRESVASSPTKANDLVAQTPATHERVPSIPLITNDLVAQTTATHGRDTPIPPITNDLVAQTPTTHRRVASIPPITNDLVAQTPTTRGRAAHSPSIPTITNNLVAHATTIAFMLNDPSEDRAS